MADIQNNTKKGWVPPLGGQGVVEEKTHMHYGAKPHLFEFAKKLRRRQTIAEEKLWKRIKNKQLMGCKFRRQHPIDKFIGDFYCHKLKLVIEVDGGYHLDEEQSQYDFNRDGEMNEFGILVYRVKNDMILNHFEDTLAELKSTIILRADFLL